MIDDKKTEEYRERAAELVSGMTLQEKVLQMRHYAPAIDRLGIKAYNYWNEALHGVARAGVATVFPQAIGLAATFDEKLVGEVADTISTEGRAKFNAQDKYGDHGIYKGLTFWAPNINIFRDPRWGRGHETYGEDPYLTSRLGCSFVRGIQGDDGNYLKAAACAKHFAVHSGPESIRHSFDAKASKKDMWETYLPAFEALVTEAGVEAVMGAYNRTNGEPCCGSRTLLDDILRKRWHFGGHVISDCWAIKDMNENHCVTKTPAESVALAVNNGCDLNCGNIFEYLVQAVEEGLVKEETIDRALTRVLTTRMKLGLFDEPDNNPYSKIDYSFVDTDDARKLNLRAALESVTMLKNDGILPLNTSKCRTIGVIGPNADNRRALVGNYEGTSSQYITVLEGIREEADKAGMRLFYSEGCHLYKDRLQGLGEREDRLAEVKAVCEQSDVIIACLGLDASLEGEEGDTGNEYGSGDKPNLLLPGLQQEILDAMAASGKPVILVMLAGSAMAMDRAAGETSAILQGWYPGALGGRAIAQIIFGKHSPEGKLPLTFYSESNTLPDFTDYSMKGRTYRYMTEKPMYPFGFGLSYTSFDEKVEAVSINGRKQDNLSEAVISKDDVLTFDVCVSNDGEFDGGVTVQCYISSDVEGAPVRQLKALKKLHLEKGEKVTVTLDVSAKSFMLCDEEGEKQLYPGNYKLFIGDSQPDERSFELTGRRCEEISITVR